LSFTAFDLPTTGPTVDVCIPTVNGKEKYLEAVKESLAAQPYPHTLYISQNMPRAMAMHEAILRGTGEIIFMLGDDTIIDRCCIARHVKHHQHTHNIAVFSYDFRAKEGVFIPDYRTTVQPPRIPPNGMMTWKEGFTAGMSFKRSYYGGTCIFDTKTFPDGWGYEDLDFVKTLYDAHGMKLLMDWDAPIFHLEHETVEEDREKNKLRFLQKHGLTEI